MQKNGTKRKDIAVKPVQRCVMVSYLSERLTCEEDEEDGFLSRQEKSYVKSHSRLFELLNHPMDRFSFGIEEKPQFVM